jgi:molybdate transport system substrate-binding protein
MRTPHLLPRRLVLIALSLPAMPGQTQPSAVLQVAAASSLAGVMPALARDYEARHPGHTVRWHSDGSGLLLDGLAQGKPADVLLGRRWRHRGARRAAPPAAAGIGAGLCRQRAGAAGGAASKLPIHRLTDLARAEVQHIAMARATSASAGRYARQAIDAARMWASVQRKIVPTDSAHAALELLLRNEVDAALVYRTEGLSAAAAVREVEVLNGHEPIRLTAAVTQASRQPEPAVQFVQYLRSEARASAAGGRRLQRAVAAGCTTSTRKCCGGSVMRKRPRGSARDGPTPWGHALRSRARPAGPARSR